MSDAQDVIVFLPARKATGRATGALASLVDGTYLALFSDEALTELAGGGYARTAITWGEPEDDVCTNSAPVNGPTATADWEEASYFGVFDAAEDGDLICSGKLVVPVAVLLGQRVRVPIGGLAVTEG